MSDTMQSQLQPAVEQQPLTRSIAEDLLYHEAALLDQRKLEAWLTLFTEDGVYWIPLDDSAPAGTAASIVHDTPLSREERVHHLLHNDFPAQSPRSRTLHLINNVRVAPNAHGYTVASNQLIYEMRTGDYKQVGLGDLQPIIASVEHEYRATPAGWRIGRKKIVLLNRDSWLGNMTFLL